MFGTIRVRLEQQTMFGNMFLNLYAAPEQPVIIYVCSLNSLLTNKPKNTQDTNTFPSVWHRFDGYFGV